MALKQGLAFAMMAPLLTTVPTSAAPRGDTDGDGKLSLTEYQALNRTRLMRTDSDGDGKISLEEWEARRAAAKSKGDPLKAFQRFDANGDGSIETGEIDPLLKRRFDRLDQNADGALSAEELAAQKTATGKE
jgi:Ca2+-binding EF-hand superfamily protein